MPDDAGPHPPPPDMGNFGSKKTSEWAWSPARYFAAERDKDDKPFALVILNMEITDMVLFESLWNNSVFRVCADGGANRLYEALRTDEARELMIPDAIVGDLDSIHPKVRAFYESRLVKIVQDFDQDATDFGKCLVHISAHSALQPPSFTENDSWRGTRVMATHNQLAVAALGGFGGRVDQSLHSIQALFTTSQASKLSGTRRELVLISSDNITFLLEPGRNIISAPRRYLGPTCGILPIGGPAIVTTRGFEWNIRGQEMRFGGLISTSNHLEADTVELETSENLVFTVEIRRGFVVPGGDMEGVGEYAPPVRSETV